ncbi:MAG TPA: hypothetical protein VNP37_20470 [Actinomycetospora sp.]|jgi:hypothetical protein|nr:hypothetical protein [Actinomycetospora sp.]
MSHDASPARTSGGAAPNRTLLIVLAWAWVGLPFLYGVYSLVLKVPALF